MNSRVTILAGSAFLLFLAAAIFLFWVGFFDPRVFTLSPEEFVQYAEIESEALNGATTTTEHGTIDPSPVLIFKNPFTKESDIENQKPLPNPPTTIKAIYATSWSAGSAKKMDALIELIDETELNAIVIDIKDFSGLVTYGTSLPKVHEYNAYELRTPKINTVLKRLHDHGIYVIARMAVFQDGQLALARPDLALMSSTTQKIWRDHKGLAWIDPAAEPAWEYYVSIAQDALDHGFDEINFDYIRFASDGNLKDIVYPHFNTNTLKAETIKKFWRYVRKALPGKVISADLFGLASVSYDDLGIGQKLEHAFGAFDAIAPMVYPSHYYAGSLGFQKPAEHPYEIVFNSVYQAVGRLKLYTDKQAAIAASSTLVASLDPTLTKSTMRPWLQDFDLGADYTAPMVRAQIQAVYDAASSSPELISGWMLWNPSNVYTKEALESATSH